MARTGIRASAIIVKDGKILLIHRKNRGREYWVFPGGGIENDDTGDETVVREIKEETGLTCTKVKFAFLAETYKGGHKHPFYSCKVNNKEIVLGGAEAKKHSEEDWYNPQWVKLDKVKDIFLVPESAKAELLKLQK